MREILFRGKNYYTKEWVLGDFKDDEWIFYSQDYSQECARIYRDTVGQFTNLLAENGDKIFEGDIIQADIFDDQVKLTGEVYMEDGCWVISGELLANAENIKILGNIHENPELLEREKE